MDRWLPIAPILIPLATAFLLPLVGRIALRLRAASAVLGLALTVAALLAMAGPVLAGAPQVYWFGGWEPRASLALGIGVVVDAWAWLFALIVAALGLLAALYSTHYVAGQTGRGLYYTLLLLLVAALIGFCLSGDLFNQFIWLEVFSVAAFALTGFQVERRAAVEAAFKYLITNSIAALFIALGLALLYMETGALNLAQIARDFPSGPAGLVALGLLLGGYATKAALLPWHFWLPDAHAVAPSPISAVFSGALIKVGLYAIGRALFTLYPLPPAGLLQAVLLAVALLSILIGNLQMLQQRGLKRLLAYSSVAQVGYVLAGLALGSPLALAAAALHVAHHALVKGALFMGAGAIVARRGIETLDEGGGLARAMPLTAGLMALAALGLAGLPATSGYGSKALLEEAALDSGQLLAAGIALLGSALTLAGMLRLLWRLFARRRGHPAAAPGEAPIVLLVPTALLVAGSLALGLFPQPALDRLAGPAGHALLDREAYIAAVLPDAAGAPGGAPGGAPAGSPERSPEGAGAADPPLQGHALDPLPADVGQWATIALVAAGGVLLAWLLLGGARWLPAAAVRAGRGLGAALAGWHSGLVNDYALWNALATSVLLIVLLSAG